MKYEIVQISPEDLSAAYKYEQIPHLEVGQGFLVPWEDMSSEGLQPHKGPQNTAYYWGKKLKRRFSTQREKRGMWIMRVA